MYNTAVSHANFVEFLRHCILWSRCIVANIATSPWCTIKNALTIRLYLVDTWPRRADEIFRLQISAHADDTADLDRNWLDPDTGDVTINVYKNSASDIETRQHRPFKFVLSDDSLTLARAVIPAYEYRPWFILHSNPHSLVAPRAGLGLLLFKQAFYFASQAKITNINIQGLIKLMESHRYVVGDGYDLEAAAVGRVMDQDCAVEINRFMSR